jgi:hypothetical protein
MSRLISAALLTVCIGVIASAQPAPRVELVARLLEFTENSVFYDFEDSSWVYHSSNFRVLAPGEYCGRALLVYHAEVPAADSPWRDVGRVFRLSVLEQRARDLLEPESHRDFLGTGWVQIVEQVAPNDVRELGDCGNQ